VCGGAGAPVQPTPARTSRTTSRARRERGEVTGTAGLLPVGPRAHSVARVAHRGPGRVTDAPGDRADAAVAHADVDPPGMGALRDGGVAGVQPVGSHLEFGAGRPVRRGVLGDVDSTEGGPPILVGVSP